jgi:MFS family permease
MAKVLIPGSIYDELLKSGMDAKMIAGTGAAFMYAYAASQLLAGVYSNRYGGVRILLSGGMLFAIGSLGFPAVKFYPLMIFFRILTGLGAGTVFLGVIKLIGDLYSEKFAMVLGTIMFFSYFGPAFGTTPMVMLTKAAGWQSAMMLPGAIAMTAAIAILLISPGTFKPIVRGETLQPLKNMLKNRSMWLINLTVPSVFGAYYILTSQLGQKSLIDHCGIAPAYAATIIMGLTLLVALNNVMGNLLLKLCRNRRKPALVISMLSSFAGCAAGYLVFRHTHSVAAVTAAFILIAIPAGFFPIFGTVAKELNPPEETGLSVALLNFWCFVYIAAFQNISGRILQVSTPASAAVYPPEAYTAVFTFLIIASLLSLLGCCFCRETWNAEKNAG